MTVCLPYQLIGFNPRLPGGRRLGVTFGLTTTKLFQSTPSGGKATGHQGNTRITLRVSIHAFRGEGDRVDADHTAFAPQFQSTPSGGKATSTMRRITSHARFQSTPSGGKATLRDALRALSLEVSIHAFRGEGDCTSCARGGFRCAVSIHAFRGEGDYSVSGQRSAPGVSIHAFRGEGNMRSAGSAASR